ncbi:hypothetical protein LOCC1_G001875 [Lachnellula occidentalis]|uniref:Tyr recombinase domain-containing protein n=1 Tax=Lachnellula occidentalis TaxID=215460 RepID=A0A8H8S6Z9_9HELO|nr:hypothetical protein LOCC1_G001875 [Lachnellula occidentalis]
MAEKISSDLMLRRISIIALPALPFMSSPLGFVEKHNRGLRKIHHLSFPEKTSINDYISEEAAYVKYTSFEEQIEQITLARPISARQLPTLSNTEIDDLNFSTALKVSFAGFLRTKEITYEPKDIKNRPVFEHTKLQRRDITFADNDEHAIVFLRSSKSDKEHQGVEIVLARTGAPSCPVIALKSLFKLDPQSPRSPLLRTAKGAFSRHFYISTLRSRLRNASHEDFKRFSGHSPRRGATQQAADFGMPNEDIQRLGRWSSDAFKGYFDYSYTHKYYLSHRFLTGRSM